MEESNMPQGGSLARPHQVKSAEQAKLTKAADVVHSVLCDRIFVGLRRWAASYLLSCNRALA